MKWLNRVLRGAPLAAAAVLVAVTSHEAPADLAGRGIDLFLHGSTQVIGGGIATFNVEALGFRTVIDAEPLPGAEVEAGWDPDSFEPVGPPVTSMKARADSRGHVHFDLPVPAGSGKIALLVKVSSGGHERTVPFEFTRAKDAPIDLLASETSVVPGSVITAWSRFQATATNKPIPGEEVVFDLEDGGVSRDEVKATTDKAGVAVARITIPFALPDRDWTLRARARKGSPEPFVASVSLVARDETPARPYLRAAFDKHSVRTGELAGYEIVVRDAVGKPIVGARVRTWVGPLSKKAPETDEEWDKLGGVAVTDSQGIARGKVSAPTLVRGASTSLKLSTRLDRDGETLSDHATLVVGAPSPSASVSPEAAAIHPGATERLLLDVDDDHGDPITGHFLLTGDGLAADVTTDQDGTAEFPWTSPKTVGMDSSAGSCAAGVSATVRVVDVAGKVGPFSACVRVDRDAIGFLRIERPILHAGEVAHLELVRSAASKKLREGGASYVLTDSDGRIVSGGWTEKDAFDVPLPKAAFGDYTVSLAVTTSEGAKSVARRLIVKPAALPTLGAAITGGDRSPGGLVDIEATLSDETGRPLQGTVSGVLIDREGGGSLEGIVGRDARNTLCAARVPREDCPAFLGEDHRLDAFRRVTLATNGTPTAPLADPAPTAKERLDKSFAEVLHSLEGAVNEATQDPRKLDDVRHKGPSGWVFNPELLTLVTQSMSEPPMTPGGEPITLTDLLALDKQVTFDHVARRVTRYKLFKVLEAVRAFRKEHAVDPKEPSLRDPAALLRRLVTAGSLQPADLVDPWGGTCGFVAASSENHPFLEPIPGDALHAPGPDGKLGTADDVKDPFERVLASRTPYAEAVEEDTLVDARLDLEVADASVESWSALITRLTGTTFGSSIGTGSGQGFGSGNGSLSGSHHASGVTVRSGATSVNFGPDAFWLPPVRTDAKGKVHFKARLPELATTFVLGITAFDDDGVIASTTLDVPTDAPLSASVEAPFLTTLGDSVSARVVLRNVTTAPIGTDIAVRVEGALRAASVPSRIHVVVPPLGEAVAPFALHAAALGDGSLVVDVTTTARVPGRTNKPLHLVQPAHVSPAGEIVARARATFAHHGGEIRIPVGAGESLFGRGRLIAERGLEPTLRAALASVDPDRNNGETAFLEGAEIATRIETQAKASEGSDAPLTKDAAAMRVRTRALFESIAGRWPAGAPPKSVTARAALRRQRLDRFVPPAKAAPKKHEPKSAVCPGGDVDAGLPTAAELLEAEPPRASDDGLTCWDEAVNTAATRLQAGEDTVALARGVIALLDRGVHTALADSLVDKLRTRVSADATGDFIPPLDLKTHDGRVVVRSALLTAAMIPDHRKGEPASVDALRSWLMVEEDASGGFGSPTATRAAVTALIAAHASDPAPSKITIHLAGGDRALTVGPESQIALDLPDGASSFGFDLEGSPVLLRFEHDILRGFDRPPPPGASSLSLEVEWPKELVRGKVARLQVKLRSARDGTGFAGVTVPLPPGAVLASFLPGVRQLQGALRFDDTFASVGETAHEIPLRFTLAGEFLAREPHASWGDAVGEPAIAPAAHLTVRER